MKPLRIPLVIVLIVVTGQAFQANAQTETNLYSFSDLPTDGHAPSAGLVQGSDGNFYGTTSSGGDYGGGSVFLIYPDGTEGTLYFFGITTNDGVDPVDALVQGSDGNFYGTTRFGGTGTNCAGGCGSVFRISPPPSGSYTNLYSFGNIPNDGFFPRGGLVQGSDGNFYGTTITGGTNGNGVVFRISPGGSYSNLYSFVGYPTDGDAPQCSLVQGSDSNFYGTTRFGGTNNFGTVFRISPSGNETNLYVFGSIPNDGQNPFTGLAQGGDGNFYGTTFTGGANGYGSVFRISPSGSYSNLHSFGGPPDDGGQSFSSLVQGSDGNLYGVTAIGGTGTHCNPGGCGIVFQISSSGSYSNLFSLGNHSSDGVNPEGGLVQASDGNFYGTAYGGGVNGFGTVFRFSVPLNPPPNQISAVQKSGTNLIFAIPSIAGETYQLQFSNSMNPTNWVNVPGVSLTNSIGALLTLTNSGGAVGPQGFYRFDITPY